MACALGSRLPFTVSMLVVMWLPARANAEDAQREVHALPCRPTVACTADIVPPGVVELEVGYAASASAGAWQQGLPLLLKLTVVDWLQLQVAAVDSFASDGLAFTSIAPGLKLHIQDQSAAAPSIAVSAALSVPAASPSGSAASTWNLFTTIHVSRDFRWLHADLNLGADVWSLERTARFQPLGALALSMEVRHHLAPMVEVHVLGDAAPIAPFDAGVLAALAWSPRPWLVFDAGIDVSFVPSTRTLTLVAGLTMAPVTLWHSTSAKPRNAGN